LHIAELCLIFGELPFRLLELNLERTGIDIYEVLALMDELTFLKIDLGDLAVDTGANGHGVERGYRSKSVEIDRKVAALRGSYHNRHYEPSSASTLAALPFAPSCWGARSLSFDTRPRSAEIPNTYGDNNDQTDDPQPAMAG
jgi:hypothetical protein